MGRYENGFTDAEWLQIEYPKSMITSGNSVYENYVIGIYTTADDSTPQDYVAAVPEPGVAGLALREWE